MKANFIDRLKGLMEEKDITQTELAQATGITQSSISDWIRGKYLPKQDKVDLLAKALDVSPAYLMGWEEPDANTTPVDLSHSILIPVLGSIPAGVPIEAIEDIVDHIDIPLKWVKSDDYFALKVRGDSMYPLFLDGDTVIIRQQCTAESGDICACYVNGFDATLKRVKISEAGAITLQPENTNYPPMTYTHPGEVRIAGKVVEVRRPV